MQCFMYYEADSYRGNISYITKILLMYAQQLGGQSRKNLDEHYCLVFEGGGVRWRGWGAVC